MQVFNLLVVLQELTTVISLTGAAMVRFTLPVMRRCACCSDVSFRRSLFVWALAVLASAWQAPTLNPAALSSDKGGLVDRLLLRSIPRPTHRSVFVGDVVAFHSPLAPVTEQVSWSRKVQTACMYCKENSTAQHTPP